jgi:hypothetical protein
MHFDLLLARAESVDPTTSNLTTVLVCGFIVLLAGGIAFIPVLIAWSRRHRRSEAIVAFALLWGLCTVLSAATTTLAWMKYEHEHEVQIESGYYDPQDTSNAPPLPWLIWGGLGAGYAALLAWSMFPGHLRVASGQADAADHSQDR